VFNDFVAMLVSLGLCLFLIPRYGAVGAALATALALIVYNVLNQIGLKYVSKINIFHPRYLWVYLSISLTSFGLGILQFLFSLPIYVGIGLAGLISLMLIYTNRKILNVAQVFPELMRFKIFQSLFSD
jgi:O-antigen/teichoic acid export membrane protein